MPVKQLSNHTALVPGSELWVLPDSSPWTAQVDWYLNFQISKSINHQPKSLSQKQVDELKAMDLPIHEPRSLESKPLMISSSKLLPNQQTLIVDHKDTAHWISTIKDVWEDLNAPSIRIFLPTGVSAQEALGLWPELQNMTTTLVESRTARN